MSASRGPVLASYLKSTERISDTELAKIIDYAFRSGNEWTWTRSSGIWKIHLGAAQQLPGDVASNPSRIMTVRLESSGSVPTLKSEPTRVAINAALRWMLLVGAIDHHPDDPQAA
jgi:hypothetical protein